MGFCQNVLFSENIGTAVSPATISVTSNPFQNSSLTFGGTADTRTTGSSTGYVGSSGSRNVFLTPTIGTNFQISSISTINRYNFILFKQYVTIAIPTNTFIQSTLPTI